MSPPQPFSVGVDSDRPLQLSFADLLLEVRHPPALGVEHRDLVLELDQRQPAHTFGANLGQDRGELLARRLQRRRACFQVLDRLAHIPYGVYPTGYTGPTIPPAPGRPNPPSRSPPPPAM